MKILGIDTSTDACAVGIYKNGEIFSRFELTPRRHTECVLPWSEELLAQAGARFGGGLVAAIDRSIEPSLHCPSLRTRRPDCRADGCAHG